MINIADKITVERVSHAEEHFFFGYYDISPESPDGKHIIVNKTSFIDHMPKLGETLEVGYFINGSTEYNSIGKTEAWNYQEGCRAQWLSNTEIVYNIRSGCSFHAVVYDIEKNEVVKEYEMPIYSISKEKQLATSYGFVNNKYSYPHTDEEKERDKFGDGVYLLDLQTGKYRLHVSIQQLAKLANSENDRNWVEYCVFAADGNHYYIYHRWENAQGLAGNQLCVADLSGKITVLLKSKFISHAGWCGNDAITAWGRLPTSFNGIQRNTFLQKTGIFNFARDIYHKLVRRESLRQKLTNDAYIMFKLGDSSHYKIKQADFVSDGHCTWSSNKRFMLTDTYPDEQDNRKLIIYDSVTDKVYLLGAFYSFPNAVKEDIPNWNTSKMRCDLHPKWSVSEEYVYFDSVHEGTRGLYRINVKKLLMQLEKGE